MPATAARIGFIQQQFRRAVAETPAIKARYGALARESEDPVETFFDSEADAQVIADARQALLGTERRRFRVVVRDAGELLDLPLAGDVLVVRYVDADRDADRPMLLSELVIDLGKQAANLTLWG